MLKSFLIILLSIAFTTRASVIPQEYQMEIDGSGGDMMSEIKYDDMQSTYEQPIVPEENKYESPYTTPATTAYTTTNIMTTTPYKTETSVPYYSTQEYSQHPEGQNVEYGSNAYKRPSKETCKPSEHLTQVEGNCHQFRLCANGIMDIMSCPNNLVFDSHLKICNLKENVSGPCGSKTINY